MKSLFLMALFLILASCATWKNVLISEGNQNVAIKNAIHDFLNSEYKSKDDSIFYVYTEKISQEILGVNIMSTYDKVLISTEDSVTFSYKGLPTGFLEKGNKLFYWHDADKDVTDDLISTYMKYNLLDTMIVNVYMPASTISHDKKGVDYYFCKNNLLKYKKVKTKKAIGYYNPPKLNCD